MRRERGIGLVELMIALTIGLFIMLGLGTVFYSMRQTSISSQGLSSLQDSERMAMTFLGNAIQGAGYYIYAQPPYTNPLTINLSPFPLSGVFAAGQTLSGTTGGSPGTDTLSVRFQVSAASNYQGCTGSVLAGSFYTDTFSIAANPADNGNPYLYCTESGSAAPIPLVAGVSGMTVLYGVDTAGSGSVTEYLAASAVTDWSAVKTVNLTLSFSNPLAQQPNQPASVTLSHTVAIMNGL